jgi:hypothetical protein
MKVSRRRLTASLTVVLLLCFSGASMAAQSSHGKAEVRQAEKHDVSPPLRDIPSAPREEGPAHEQSKPKPIPVAPSTGANDPVVQSAPGRFAGVNAGGFEGVGLSNYAVNAAPPDTNGSVGATQYVQWVNEAFAVFDKTTGAIAPGFPKNGNTLWSGFGGPCETNNDGDPIAQYDKANNRWVMTQFSVTNGGSVGYWQCIAVSTTSDATGSYNRYAFREPNFNDYPKLGVWPDAYYITYNIFNGNSFGGARACAYDSAKMRAGTAASEQCFQLSTSFGGLLPSDLDGTTAPPAGSPEYFANFGSNSLNIWKFHVDWTTPANSTFTGPTNLAVAAFSAACGGGGTCITQPSTSQDLDSLADRLMYRLAYRNMAGTETLLVNHSVTAGGANKHNQFVGVRWYELRKAGVANFSVFQQGTFAPDSNNRWMGSIAMDKFGNIAAGYSVSSGSVFPSIRFAGRAATDPLGTLGQEVSILSGSGSQLRTLNRWGDYSNMSVDPVDDCTMYYTTEYLASSGTFNWRTFVGKIKLPGCN